MGCGMSQEENKTATESPSTRKQGDDDARPRFCFNLENSQGKTEHDYFESRVPKRRYENEDPNANALFPSVNGYSENLQSESQETRPAPYHYPPAGHMNGSRRTPRVHGEDKAADELLGGAGERRLRRLPGHGQVPANIADAEKAIWIQAELARSRLGAGRTEREVGEDPAADALFGNQR